MSGNTSRLRRDARQTHPIVNQLRLCAVIATITTAALVGCSGEGAVVPVRGQLLGAGAPAADVLITFVPDTGTETSPPVSRGTTDAEGRFELVCDDGRPGAAVGPHRVVLEDLRPFRAPRNERPSTAPPPVSRFDPRYASARDTPLRHEVAVDGPPATIEAPLRAAPPR